MTININNRAKSGLPATYLQANALTSNDNVTILGIPAASWNARITKCMDRWVASEAIDAARNGEEVTIQFN